MRLLTIVILLDTNANPFKNKEVASGLSGKSRISETSGNLDTAMFIGKVCLDNSSMHTF
jgi:hypothetical protein